MQRARRTTSGSSLPRASRSAASAAFPADQSAALACSRTAASGSESFAIASAMPASSSAKTGRENASITAVTSNRCTNRRTTITPFLVNDPERGHCRVAQAGGKAEMDGK
jgi:hypothetical protein